MTTTSTVTPEHPKPTVHGAWACGGLAAASFGGILAIVNGRLTGAWFMTAIICLAFAIAPLLLYVYLGRDTGNNKISRFGREFINLAIIASCLGLSAMLAGYNPWVGGVFLISCGTVAMLVLVADRRAKHREL